MDVVGPLPESEGKKYILSVLDRTSRWIECYPMANATSADCCKAFLEWTSRYGLPQVAVSDNGNSFVANLYKDIMDTFGVKVRFTYNDVADEVFGKAIGGRIVNAAQLIELAMTCILYVVLCGDLLIGAFEYGWIDTRSYMMLCGILLLPCAFLKNLKAVSNLSFWNGVVHIIINVLIIVYCILNIQNWAFSKVTFSVDILSFPIALGIIVFSYTSQIFVCTLEENMVDKNKFHCMMHWSHIAAAACKAGFGYIAFLNWQEDTQEVIVNNIDGWFKVVVNIILVVKALLSYPLPYYAACGLIEEEMFKDDDSTPFPSIWSQDGELKVWGCGFRVACVLVTILFAVFVPHFSLLMGFIGNFTGCLLSFVWPCVFHLYLR